MYRSSPELNLLSTITKMVCSARVQQRQLIGKKASMLVSVLPRHCGPRTDKVLIHNAERPELQGGLACCSSPLQHSVYNAWCTATGSTVIASCQHLGQQYTEWQVSPPITTLAHRDACNASLVNSVSLNPHFHSRCSGTMQSGICCTQRNLPPILFIVCYVALSGAYTRY